MIGHPDTAALRRFAHDDGGAVARRGDAASRGSADARDAASSDSRAAATPARSAAHRDEATRVAKHLARCARCRREVELLRRVRTALRELDAGVPAPDILERVLARRVAGERVIVPEVVRLATPRPRWRTAAVAACALLGALALASVATLPRAVAASSELEFLPHAPRAGADLRVVYRAGSLLAGEDTLVLRGRYRTADTPRDQPSSHHEVAVLVRRGDGAFHGALRLPDPVVYGAFAVEDRAGERIDHNRNRSWTLEVHGADGRPEIAAMQQRLYDLTGGSWEARLETARRMTELYPDDPRGWAELWPLEDLVATPENGERLRAAYAARFAVLHESLAATPELPADVVAAMIRYGNPRDINEHWLARLQREHGRDARAVTHRVFAAQAAATERDRAAAYLTLAEQVWNELEPELGTGHGIWTHNAIMYARRLGDASVVVRWTGRMLRHGAPPPHARLAYLDALPELGGSQPDVVDLIRRQVDEWREPHEAARPLHVSRSAHARQTAQLHRGALARLGRALLMRGDTAAGLALLRDAAAEGWDAALFRTVAHELLAAGDTLDALRHLALLSVDPEAGDEAHAARAAAVARFEPVAWSAWRADALARFRATMLADTMIRPLRGRVTVLDRERRPHTLATLLDRRLTVIAFMAHGPSAARTHLPMIEALHDWLAERGVNFIVLARWPAAAEMRLIYGDDARRPLPVYFDALGEARDALHKIFVPSFFVVDASGLIVFEHVDLGMVRRRVAALLASQPIYAEVR